MKLISKLLISGLIVIGAFAFSPKANAACYVNQLFIPNCPLTNTDLNNSFSQPPVIGAARPNSANFTNINVNSISASGPIIAAQATSAGAGLILAPGANPVSPVNGSLWTTSAGLFAQINGSTIGPFGSGGGGGGGGSAGGSTNSVQINTGSGFGGVAITDGQLLVGRTSTAPSPQTPSGDCTMSILAVLTCTKTSGSNFGALALLNTASVAVGGTGLAAGTSGGIPAYTATGTMASSALLTANAVVVGGGAGATPSTVSGLGTAGNVLVSVGGSGKPVWGPVNVGTGITGAFSSVAPFNGGTNASSTTCWFGDLTWKTCGSGGASSLTVTDGTTSITGTTQITVKGLVASGSGGLATVAPSTATATSVANYSITAADMGNVRNMNGTNLTLTIPAISGTVFASGMETRVCNYNATAVTISTTPTINGYASTIPGKTTVANCVGLTSNGTSIDAAPLTYTANQLLSNVVAQTFTGGVIPTAFSNGTASSGTKTLDCGNGPIQTLTNGGAHTIAVAANDGSCVVRITNNGSAGTITFSGFSQGSNSGDALTTTNTNKFDLAITRVGGNPSYVVHALQ